MARKRGSAQTRTQVNPQPSHQPSPGLSQQPLAVLWQRLAAQPLDALAWSGLAAAYGQQGLAWQHAHVCVQAMRCSRAGSKPLAVADLAALQAGPLVWPEGAEVWLTRPDALWTGWAEVVQALQAQVQAEPGDWLSWLYLARCLEQGTPPQPGQPPDPPTREAVRRAVALEPLPGETGYLLALWRLKSGQPERALVALRAVLLQAPQRHGSWLLQAQAQMQLGLYQEAQTSFERAGHSQNPAFLSLLAEKLFFYNFADQALSVREAVTQLQPGNVLAWLALAEVQSKLWQLAQAQQSVQRALQLEPDNVVAQRLAKDIAATGHSREQFDAELTRYQAEGLQTNGLGAQRLLMQSLYQAHLSPEQVAQLHTRLARDLLVQAQQGQLKDLPPPSPEPWDAKRRLRVGYVSGDLHRQHPVNVFMLPVLLRHDHAALEVFVYQTGTLIDEYTRQARASADHWREAAHLSDVALRQMIVGDRIDVLVDLAGHTASQRLGVFATRPAPVQMTYLGYPHSTGLDCMDWIIADAVVAPPEHAHLFSEQIARVSGSVFCWAPVDDYPLPPDATEARIGPVVFASFNNLLKMDDATLAVWARILRECPDSQLLLKSAVLADPVVMGQTQERFAAHGVDASRLQLRGPTELSQMMQEYLEVDVALDPFPYNGGTTSLQALWMGCPLVSLQGGNFVSRMGASFLTHLGRPQWLAHSVEDYVAKAVALARQVRQAPWSRQAQRAAMQASGLCQIERHTREIEAIYRQAMDKR